MTTVIIEKMYDGDFSVKLRSGDVGLFRLGIDSLKSFISVPARSYDPHEKRWIIAGLAQDSLFRWVNYCTVNLHAKVEWLNGDPRRRQRQESSWAPPPPRRQLTKEDAYRTLYLQPNSPPDLVRVVFKYLATVYHPDKQSGDEEKMKAINAAYKQLAA